MGAAAGQRKHYLSGILIEAHAALYAAICIPAYGIYIALYKTQRNRRKEKRTWKTILTVIA